MQDLVASPGGIYCKGSTCPFCALTRICRAGARLIEPGKERLLSGKRTVIGEQTVHFRGFSRHVWIVPPMGGRRGEKVPPPSRKDEENDLRGAIFPPVGE